jgi:hypothetical protein
MIELPLDHLVLVDVLEGTTWLYDPLFNSIWQHPLPDTPPSA